MKIVAQGLILHKHAYLKDPWSCLDLVLMYKSTLQSDVYIVNMEYF
jgi:hypothetical protein